MDSLVNPWELFWMLDVKYFEYQIKKQSYAEDERSLS